MKHIIYTLSDAEQVRYVGCAPAGDSPLAALDRIRKAGIKSRVGDWLDALEAAEQDPECRVILSIGVGGRTAMEFVRLLSTTIPGLLNDPPRQFGVITPCVAIDACGVVTEFPSIRAMEKAGGVGRNGFRDRMGRIDRAGVLRIVLPVAPCSQNDRF